MKSSGPSLVFQIECVTTHSAWFYPKQPSQNYENFFQNITLDVTGPAKWLMMVIFSGVSFFAPDSPLSPQLYQIGQKRTCCCSEQAQVPLLYSDLLADQNVSIPGPRTLLLLVVFAEHLFLEPSGKVFSFFVELEVCYTNFVTSHDSRLFLQVLLSLLLLITKNLRFCFWQLCSAYRLCYTCSRQCHVFRLLFFPESRQLARDEQLNGFPL